MRRNQENFKGELKEEDLFSTQPVQLNTFKKSNNKTSTHQQIGGTNNKTSTIGMEELIEIEELKRKIKELELENIKLKE
jgi:hypothetical protein